MKFKFESEAQHKINKFTRLGTWYILALAIVATVIIIGQLLIQSHLKDQLSDSRVINVAGKQRMLSQKITKTILLLQDEGLGKRKERLDELRNSAALWKISQDGLLYGNDSLHLPGKNSDAIIPLFEKVNVHFDKMFQSSLAILSKLGSDENLPADSLRSDVTVVLEQEAFFLKGMEGIVLQYDKEAQEKVAVLSTMEYILLIISLLVIIIEIVFIFRPTAIHVNKTINELLTSEKNSLKMTNEIRTLYASLEKSYEQISLINQPVDNPRLFAKCDRGGNVTFIAPVFSTLSDIDKIEPSLRLIDLFPRLANANDWLDEVVDTVSEGIFWQGEVHFNGKDQHDCWVDLIISPVCNEANEVEEWVVMGSDITKQKTAEQKLNRKHQAEIENRINQQKFRSVLILEGQEEERKRIAMDIHDGIGQMLTSLKYHVESVDLSAEDKAQRKLSEIDQLIKQVIKEVRKVTFNLKPTVLGDYGLQAALHVFVKEMGKLVEPKLEFHAESDIVRLPQKVENNIFRIMQEAINNAIKYSGAEKIDVQLKQGLHEVIAIVKDEGVGFDTRIVEKRSVNIESGRGLFNMYERTEYINGLLDIFSSPGKGTTVTLTVPVQSV
ncbi:MAG: type IV pili methyl-accepting chemotaxis transducer N-terminal domain-containing protein [Cyclobacteriaceae bacterium]|nr:type IV pili methyl-accepting chemotaxis transducer N-terminal domain-containing protein [Cyclobacteriaceae bacterium]